MIILTIHTPLFQLGGRLLTNHSTERCHNGSIKHFIPPLWILNAKRNSECSNVPLIFLCLQRQKALRDTNLYNIGYFKNRVKYCRTLVIPIVVDYRVLPENKGHPADKNFIV